ncbi:unnamed protein product [Symbiodinium natans]|uniref:Pentatricopeptide repeat-containing protein-mitochondrial domain-containing protein n=1 Tax=Symbiodinium natans TaxID=878477 RepID=A0A812R2D3_9DINO|nr:unnamed protein product [Symbiodinium natans]
MELKLGGLLGARALAALGRIQSQCASVEDAMELLRMTRQIVQFAREGLWEHALDVFKQMRRMGECPDAINYNALVGALTKSLQLHRAVSMCDEMTNRRLEMNGITFSPFLKHCHAWWQALFVLSEMSRSHHVPPALINACMSACLKAHRLSLVFMLWNQMRSSAKIAVDAITYSVVLKAFQQSSEWALAIELFAKLHSRLGIDAVAFNTMLDTCEKATQWQRGLQLFCDAPVLAVEPDAVSHATVLSSLNKGFQWMVALEMFSRFAQRRGYLDTAVCNTAMNSCALGKKWIEAARLYEDLRRVGLPPNVMTWNTLLNAFEKGVQWLRALSYLQGWRASTSSTSQMDTVSVNTVVSACARAYRWQQALDVFSVMSSQSVPMNVVTFGTLISASCRGGMWMHGLGLLAKARQLFGPQAVLYSSVAAACHSCQMWELALVVRQECLQLGLPIDLPLAETSQTGPAASNRGCRVDERAWSAFFRSIKQDFGRYSAMPDIESPDSLHDLGYVRDGFVHCGLGHRPSRH